MPCLSWLKRDELRGDAKCGMFKMSESFLLERVKRVSHRDLPSFYPSNAPPRAFDRSEYRPEKRIPRLMIFVLFDA